jgi:hypothetical protein
MRPVNHIGREALNDDEPSVMVVGLAFESPEEVLDYAAVASWLGTLPVNGRMLREEADTIAVTGSPVTYLYEKAEQTLDVITQASEIPLSQMQRLGCKILGHYRYEPPQSKALRLLDSYHRPRPV